MLVEPSCASKNTMCRSRIRSIFSLMLGLPVSNFSEHIAAIESIWSVHRVGASPSSLASASATFAMPTG